ncbi:threonine/serine ThrE exporter family protein [Acaricomes phytoseiuli]|uniref:threonine/serine ThrE exporter family protein n=1 Tax=Acaricomes phytoseiuli TaxID=291968 RepID=UPI003873814C
MRTPAENGPGNTKNGAKNGEGSPSQASREKLAAKRRLRRLVSGEAPPTAPMNIVDRLAGSPYANPTIQVGDVDKSARKTIDFTLLLAETMFRFGAGALEVETSAIAVTAAFGLRNVEVDINNQSVAINYAPKNATPITVLRVVRSWTNNYAGLALVHQLVTDVISGGMDRQSAERRLQTILKQPKPFPRWMVTLATVIFSGCVVAVLGGGIWGALAAGAASLLVGLLTQPLRRWRVPDFFITAAGAFVITGVALIGWFVHLPIAPGLVVTGGILLLLPSGRLVSAVQDAINGFPVTAAGRFLSAFLTFGAIVAGIGIASVVGLLVGADHSTVLQSQASAPPPLPLVLVLILIATALIGVAEQTLPRLLLPTAVTGLIGYAVFLGISQLGIGPRLAPAVGAVAVGFVARFIALRLGAPQLVVAVPSILFLLTGLAIFRAMFSMTVADDVSLVGIIGLFNAIVVILGVAAGVVFGDNLARPFLHRQGSYENFRAPRR